MVDAAQAAPLAAPILPARAEGYWRGVWRRLRRDPVAMGAGLVLLTILGLAVFAPWIAPADPIEGRMLMRLRPIGDPDFPLGSDELGRDMLSRLP